MLASVDGARHLGEPRGKRGNLLVETVKGLEQGRLPVGHIAHVLDRSSGFPQRPGQFGYAPCDLLEVSAFTLV
jgi:hypothetical protein